MNNKIYVSGKITGLQPIEAKRLFKKGAEEAAKYAKEVVNIYEAVPYNPDTTWQEYMVKDIEILLSCDSIYMLNNWQTSKGARIEHAIASILGINIIYQ